MSFSVEVSSRTLRVILEAFGLEVFADSRRLLALMKDLMPRNPDECSIISEVLALAIPADTFTIEKLKSTVQSDDFIVRCSTGCSHSSVDDVQAAISTLISSLDSFSQVEEIQIDGGYLSKDHLVNRSMMIATILSRCTTVGYKTFSSFDEIANLTIPDNITKICSLAFVNCRNLQSLTVLGSQVDICSAAFHGCNALTSINISDSRYIVRNNIVIDRNQKSILWVCCGAKGILSIPEGITQIPAYSIEAKSITRINLPCSLTKIDASSIFGCTALEWIQVPSANRCYASVEGVLYCKSTKTLILYPLCHAAKAYYIEETTERIGQEAFAGSAINAVTIPNSVRYLGRKAFYRCSAIEQMIIPRGVEEIAYSCFSECSNLATVLLPNTIREIDDFAFSDCLKLERISLPVSITRIGDYAFSGCKRLTSIRVSRNLAYIGYNAFVDCAEDFYIEINDNPYAERYCRLNNIQYKIY